MITDSGASNELIIRWPPTEGKRFKQRQFLGAVVVTDSGGEAVALPVTVSFVPPTQLSCITRSISVLEDSAETIFTQRAHDDDIDPGYVNPETLEWRVSVVPESLGEASVTVAEEASV